MPIKNKLYLVLGIVAIATISGSLTYYFAPSKVEIKEVEKIVRIKGETKVVNRDIVRIITKKPDGTIIEKEIDKSKETEEKSEVVNKETNKSKKIVRSKKDWNVYTYTDSSLQNFTLGVQRRILGDIYIGVQGSSDKEVRFGIGFSF